MHDQGASDTSVSVTGLGIVNWRSEAGFAAPRRFLVVDDTVRADDALKKMRNGVGLVWQGDFQNARQLLQALGRRLDKNNKLTEKAANVTLNDRFHRYRMQQGQRARLLGMLLVKIEPDNTIALRRAPMVKDALEQVYPAAVAPYLISLRELQGIVGAYEWRRKGVSIPAFDLKIHPHYGVFSPSRAEYLDLLAAAPLPENCNCAFDIGVGTGVLSILLARKGVAQITATDSSARAIACANENIARLGLGACIKVEHRPFFPEGKAQLLVCNPPWLPGKVTSTLDAAIYDPESRMLTGFLEQARDHLAQGGQIWLIMSDLAELLALREPDALPKLFTANGLQVHAVHEGRPVHARPADKNDPLFEARSRETTRLWCLVPIGTEN